MEESLFITPITMVQGINGVAGVQESSQTVTGEDGISLFRSFFEDAIQNVVEGEENVAKQEYLLATGQIDDPHTVPIAASELQLSVSMLVQLRNRALEAYNTLISISM